MGEHDEFDYRLLPYTSLLHVFFPFTFFSGLQQPCFFPIHFLLRSTATHGQPRSCVVAAALGARLLGGKKEGRGLALLIM